MEKQINKKNSLQPDLHQPLEELPNKWRLPERFHKCIAEFERTKVLRRRLVVGFKGKKGSQDGF